MLPRQQGPLGHRFCIHWVSKWFLAIGACFLRVFLIPFIKNIKIITMKKWSVLLMLVAGAWSFQACNDNSNDAVENAKEANENKLDSNKDGMDSSIASTVSENDSKFMVEAANGGMMEVQLGNIAKEKGTSQKVKDFGEMMVTDHSKANDELKAIANRKNVTLPATVSDDKQKMIDDLSKKTGTDFDKAYMKMMVDDHQEDVEAFEKAAGDVTDTDVKAFAASTLPVLRKHLSAAEDIHKALK